MPADENFNQDDILDEEDLIEIDEDDLEEEDLEDEDEDDLEEEDLEESAASETLKPSGGSKAETLATFTSLLAQLGKEDLSTLFNQVQDQFGPNKAPGACDKSDSNENTIKAKSSAAKGSGSIPAMPMQTLSVKEDLNDILSGEELTEDFKEKASVIFEAALNTRANLEYVRLAEEYEELVSNLNEEYENKLEEATNDIIENLTDKLDQYLDYCVEQWMEENKLTIENSLRAELAESFIQSLYNVFSEHYIKVPEESFDIVADLKEQVDSLNTKLTATIDENLNLKSELNSSKVESIIDELSEGLTVSQSEKLYLLAEGVNFTDEESFRNKMEILKEAAFTKMKTSDTGLITESIDGSTDLENNEILSPGMDRYIKAISKK